MKARLTLVPIHTRSELSFDSDCAYDSASIASVAGVNQPVEDRCTIDVIITKFFPLRFKMAESFKNVGNILHDGAKDKYKTSIIEALNWYKKHTLAGRRRIKPFLFSENHSDEKKSLGQSAVERELNQTQNWSSYAEKHCSISNLANPVNKLAL